MSSWETGMNLGLNWHGYRPELGQISRRKYFFSGVLPSVLPKDTKICGCKKAWKETFPAENLHKNGGSKRPERRSSQQKTSTKTVGQKGLKGDLHSRKPPQKLWVKKGSMNISKTEHKANKQTNLFPWSIAFNPAGLPPPLSLQFITSNGADHVIHALFMSLFAACVAESLSMVFPSKATLQY